MAIERWVAGSGVGLTWTACFGTEINSIVNGNSILSSVDIDNTTALDMFCDLSIALGSAAFVAPNYLAIYIYPLNQDGTTYGDGMYVTSNSAQPGGNYWVGNLSLVPATQAQTGTISRIIIPPGHFKFVLTNQGGATLAGSANAIYYRTYNRQVS